MNALKGGKTMRGFDGNCYKIENNIHWKNQRNNKNKCTPHSKLRFTTEIPMLLFD